MRLKILLFILLPSFWINCLAQSSYSSKPIEKTLLYKPSILSTHPYGILFSRWQGNFQSEPLGKLNLTVNLENGNVWSPPVVAFIPNIQEDRELASQFIWYSREFRLDVNTLNAKSIEVQNDGVIRGLRVNFNLPINSKSELKIGLRTFVLTKGRVPFSFVTNDEVVEFFHENIAGGDDPFDRQLYPLNEGLIRYSDRNNRVMTIETGDFIFSGFEFSYYRFTDFNFKGIKLNYAAHLGLNTSEYNQSLDLGASVNILRAFALNNDQSLAIGLSLGGTMNNLVDFVDDNMDFSSNILIGFLEVLTEYSFLSRNKRTQHSFGMDFYFQTSLNKKSEFDYIIPTRNGTSFKSWNSGVSNLYRNNNYWTLMYTLRRKVAFTVYVQQDLTVNNNPDIQTGLSLSFNL